MGQVCSENRGLARAGDVLRETHGEFLVSKQKLKKAEGICLVREKREAAAQTLGFTARPFVLCGLPIRRPPEGQLLFERRNGALHSSDYGSSGIWIAVWSGSTHSDFLGNHGNPAEEPNRTV